MNILIVFKYYLHTHRDTKTLLRYDFYQHWSAEDGIRVVVEISEKYYDKNDGPWGDRTHDLRVISTTL